MYIFLLLSRSTIAKHPSLRICGWNDLSHKPISNAYALKSLDPLVKWPRSHKLIDNDYAPKSWDSWVKQPIMLQVDRQLPCHELNFFL